ncbi:MAG: hypothetical protein M0P73_09185 [Syntrophobacterales bacterium]|jgi:hypothetical protein|nr:hypothetical protein [Syntrophobacterales bacterium]
MNCQAYGVTVADQQHPDAKRPRGSDIQWSRTLIYFPIVHTQADMGNLGEQVTRATLRQAGQRGLQRKLKAIDQVWTSIETALKHLNLPYDQVRLYQDGLPVCGREAELVRDLAQEGSRNHLLLQRLMSRGAALMGTESGDLLRQEYDLARQHLTASGGLRPAAATARQRALSAALLVQRDQFIAHRINDTLKTGETGILFLGLLHSVEKYLDRDIQVIFPLPRPRL